MKTITVKLPESLYERLAREAGARSVTASQYVRDALEERIAANPSLSAFDLLGDAIGCAEGPGDLSTNPKYLEGYGQPRARRQQLPRRAR